MPLLDGQYQIITEKHISPKHSIFEVLDEADMSLRVMWYQLDEAEEIAFEDYRALLRALRREGVVAIRDVVSRPGAHYVVWEAPPVDEYPRKARELLSYQESLAVKGYQVHCLVSGASEAALPCDVEVEPANTKDAGVFKKLIHSIPTQTKVI
ncbi:MAG: hypothetical protein R2880_21840 [Deinococcales bacterium]